jgi:putative ABC transport system permease protein
MRRSSNGERPHSMAPVSVLFRFVSRPELRARPIRSVLMAGTVAVGVALLTAMHVATESIVGGYAADLERLAGKADLQIAFGTGETGFSEELVVRVASSPGVAQAAALVRGQVTFEDEPRETVELFGIDILQHDVLDLYEVKVLEREKDDFTILNDPRGVFVTDVIAGERGLELGSRLRLSAVDGIHEYTVRGIVATSGLAEFLGGRLVAMYLPAAQPVAGRRGDLTASMVDQIDVRLREGVKTGDARIELGKLLGPGFRVDTPLQRRLSGEHTVEGLRATLVGMSSLALLASLFIVYASTTTMVAQRVPAMATLVSIGASPRALVQVIVAEAALLGVVGSLSGTVVGLLLASFIGEDAAAGMGLNYSLPFEAGRVAWDPLVVFAWIPIGGVLASAGSAYAPARRLRSVTPLALERGAESDDGDPSQSPRSVPWIGISLALLGGGLLWTGIANGSPDAVSVGGVLFIAASVLCALPILRVLWMVTARVLPRLQGIAGRIAAENLQRSMDRSLVTASAIMLSVAIAVGAGSLVRSFRASVSDWYGFSGDALVSARSVTGGWLASPLEQRLESDLARLPSVRKIDTLRVLQGQPYDGERIAVVGLSEGLLEIAADRGSYAGQVSREEALAKLKAGQGAAVSRNFASHFGTDSLVSVSTLAGTLDLPVVAIVPDYVSDQGSVIVHRQLVSDRWHDAHVNYFAVRLHPGRTVADLVQEVNGSIESAPSLAVMHTSAMIAKVDGLIGKAFADIDTIKLLVLFLTAVGIADLVVSNALWRRRELAVLRLVGLTEGQVIRTAFLEGIWVTLGAAVCGAAIGTLCAFLWVNYNYPVLVGYVLDLRVSWDSIAVSFALAALSASIAAVAAAKYSLRQPALQVIRFES